MNRSRFSSALRREALRDSRLPGNCGTDFYRHPPRFSVAGGYPAVSRWSTESPEEHPASGFVPQSKGFSGRRSAPGPFNYRSPNNIAAAPARVAAAVKAGRMRGGCPGRQNGHPSEKMTEILPHPIRSEPHQRNHW